MNENENVNVNGSIVLLAYYFVEYSKYKVAATFTCHLSSLPAAENQSNLFFSSCGVSFQNRQRTDDPFQK